MQVKVVKFGGSSLADAGQFKKVAEIIKADSARRYVVPSAPGKRTGTDIKVTDMLYTCYDMAGRGEDFSELYAKIKDRFNGIIKELGLKLSLEKEFGVIEMAFKYHAGRDYAASRGEYLNGIILADYLGYEFIDAAKVIFFNDAGAFDAEYTNAMLSQRLAKTQRAVIPGFYGSMPNDTIKTFSRGGSDVTGSIVARAAGATVYENWTDVSGFLMADPRIVSNPRAIDVITYRELRELSYMGATVLHEDCIFPVRVAKIPINIKNTNEPSATGTFIVANDSDLKTKLPITGIAGKKGFSVISIEKDMMNQEIGFGRKVLTVLERNHLSFEHIPSGIDTMSVVISSHLIMGKETDVIEELYLSTGADNIEIESGLALIAVVGDGMRKTKGTAAKVFSAAAEAGVNIKMIDQGSSELNIILGVAEDDFEKTISAIYKAFSK